MADTNEEPLHYRLLTGLGDRAFCERISRALDSGYELYGSPVLAFKESEIVSAQAVVLREDNR